MAVGWGGLGLAAVGFWGLQVLACAPLLGAGTIRSQLRRGPSNSLVGNYLLIVTLAVAGHVATFLGGVAVTGGFEGRAVLAYVFGVAIGYPLLVGVGIYIGSQAREPSVPALALVLAAIWYASVAILAAATVFLVLFALFFPG